MRQLLEAGVTRRAIARELGVSPSTVTRVARLLDFPDLAPRPSTIDWAAVQRYYDEGHTIDECKAIFGFSYGAWDKAATRGDIVSRARSERQLSWGTRDEVEHLLAEGLTQAQIRRRLGISKSTVAYHVRRLGIRADPRFARRHDWTEVQRAIDEENFSMTQCLRRFGFGRDAWYRAVRRGDVVPNPHKASMEELLVSGPRRNRGHIKFRLIKEGFKENRCESCGITSWMGKPLSMELHHINGDGCDNGLENLELLCGNCHSQTDNWGGRGTRRKPSLNGSVPGKHPAS
jgi:transcriptional regulator with XRE-family HTH domain